MFIRGKILIFEGPDGVGKTTLINFFKKKVQKPFYIDIGLANNFILILEVKDRVIILDIYIIN